MKISFCEAERLEERVSLSNEHKSILAELLSCGTDEAEILFSISHGCLLYRIYDAENGYYFWAPTPFLPDASLEGAYSDLAEYARLEAIKEVYVDIPKEHLPLITDKARWADVFLLDGDGELYAVEVGTECTECEHLPKIMLDDVFLSDFARCHADAYRELITDKEVNKYYGYVFTDDGVSDDGESFIAAAREQFERGEAMNFAVTVLLDGKNELIGDATLYAFDGRGSASSAFRLLKKWQGKGYGEKIIRALIALCESLGISKLLAEVDPCNERSLRLLRKYASERQDTGRAYFSIDIPEASE